MTVQNFMKIVWTVFEKFEIFMERSGEKKRHDWISSRNFFPTPKKSLDVFTSHSVHILMCEILLHRRTVVMWYA